MDIPSTPVTAGQQVAGQVSWFGGPHDPEDSGHTASGGSTREPGIAVYNRATLGGYWRVTAANGRSAVLRQTDLGPAPWTHRSIDVTYSALGKLGYNEQNFPTDSRFTAVYLGRNPNAIAQGQGKGQKMGLNPKEAHPDGTSPREVPDKQAFKEAQGRHLLAKMFADEKSSGENPLLQSGLLPTKAPTQTEYTKIAAPNLKLGGVPGVSRETRASTNSPPEKLGGLLKASAPLEYERIDQGQDIQTRPGEALLAPGEGEVIAVKADPSGFGPDYPVVRFTSGPLEGQTIYLGHTDTALKAGERFKEGQTIAHTSKTGHNAPPGWAEIGMASALGQGIHNQGAQIASYLRKR